MKVRAQLIFPLVLLLFCLTGTLASAASQQELLDQWKPKFDPSGAKYTYILSNVDHPAIEGIAVGYHIRDRLWERSNGQIYVDFRPFAQMGGEKDVISKLKMGAVQGMLCSSVAAVNVASTLGIVNLPFVIDSFDKLERFRNEPELFRPFSLSGESQGVKVVDFTGYGTYGWATTTPVRTLADANNTNFRVAQAPVNADIYKAWGLKFTVMPWPDVPQALATGVINGLDHTPIVCSITNKFDVAKYFTRLDYAQGLYIHLMNKKWFDALPADLQAIMLEVIAEESAKARALTLKQQDEQIAAAQKQGIEFITLSQADRQKLVEKSEPVYQKWGEKIGADYLKKVRETLAQ
ncbi:TRAP transporter substrate-binding protein [Desulfuromonas sp. AOP6]|uniref:TRAP transporter substrate-binding protein n=1 Tax=Desulfuromonas sp. AOP6 TaxID=1566351 RepID=UPI001274C4B0|nr:TRAP transporter substrate-binding protein [Desulfuromonas sp. AOP6]BCA81150.1 TRAP transporter substrate-binding protein DctP [Desulfuromonas sp. AOP6]